MSEETSNAKVYAEFTKSKRGITETLPNYEETAILQDQKITAIK